ncbi:MAG: hypothetical protein V1874_08370 [Spirochaetota bacterium]
MKRNINVISFEMEGSELRFDPETSILLCRLKAGGRKLWVKKLNDLFVSDIIEDSRRYYIACGSGEINGQFLAVKKESGSTSWFIPGRSFLHLLYKGFLYLIFADDKNNFYLLKVHVSNGKSAWFHPVDADLKEYVFMGNKIKLKYLSNKFEIISVKNGKSEDF